MNILIIGANGYTGSYLARSYLNNQHSVQVLLSKNNSVNNLSAMISQGLTVLGSLDSWSKKKGSQLDAVFSLVGYPINDHEYGDIEHLVGSQLAAHTQALEIGRQHNCPVVIAGSYWETIRSLNDSALNLYSALNVSSREIADFFHHKFGVKTCRILLADTYGPLDWRNKLIPTLLNSSKNSAPYALGSPRQKMAPLFVSDVIKGLQLGLVSLQQGVNSYSTYQLFPNSVVEISDVVANLEKILGRKILISWNERSIVRHEIYDIKRAFVPPPGWSQKVSFLEGLDLSAKANISILDELQ